MTKLMIPLRSKWAIRSWVWPVDLL